MFDIKRIDYQLTADDVTHLNSLSPDVRELVKTGLRSVASAYSSTATRLESEPTTDVLAELIENRRALAAVYLNVEQTIR